MTSTPTVRKKLLELKPNFHPGSEEASPVGWAMTAPGLRWMEVYAGGVAMEFGAGWSTCILAEQCEHVFSFDPLAEKHERISTWLKQHFPELLPRITTHCGPSTDIINTSLAPEEVDFLMIDGLHAFPTPMIDWYFGVQHLKVGGRVLLDDRRIWSVSVLADFLSEQPGWKMVWHDVNQIVFELTQPFNPNMGHGRQPYVMTRSRGIRRPAMATGGCASGRCSIRRPRPLSRDGEE